MGGKYQNEGRLMNSVPTMVRSFLPRLNLTMNQNRRPPQKSLSTGKRPQPPKKARYWSGGGREEKEKGSKGAVEKKKGGGGGGGWGDADNGCRWGGKWEMKGNVSWKRRGRRGWTQTKGIRRWKWGDKSKRRQVAEVRERRRGEEDVDPEVKNRMGVRGWGDTQNRKEDVQQSERRCQRE